MTLSCIKLTNGDHIIGEYQGQDQGQHWLVGPMTVSEKFLPTGHRMIWLDDYAPYTDATVAMGFFENNVVTIYPVSELMQEYYAVSRKYADDIYRPACDDGLRTATRSMTENYNDAVESVHETMARLAEEEAVEEIEEEEDDNVVSWADAMRRHKGTDTIN